MGSIDALNASQIISLSSKTGLSLNARTKTRNAKTRTPKIKDSVDTALITTPGLQRRVFSQISKKESVRSKMMSLHGLKQQQPQKKEPSSRVFTTLSRTNKIVRFLVIIFRQKWEKRFILKKKGCMSVSFVMMTTIRILRLPTGKLF